MPPKNIEEKIQEINLSTKEWDKQEEYLLKKKALKDRKKQLSSFKLTTSKLLTFLLFLNCTAIEIFTGWVIINNIKIATILMTPPDLSPLIALIGAVVGETIGFAIYCIKAAKENCKGGIIYQQAMLDNTRIYTQTLNESEDHYDRNFK